MKGEVKWVGGIPYLFLLTTQLWVPDSRAVFAGPHARTCPMPIIHLPCEIRSLGEFGVQAPRRYRNSLCYL
jgi:hypothetical protein